MHTIVNLVTWVLVIATELFLTPLFAALPEAVLAALIIHAVWHIIASRKLQQVRLVSRTEFVLGLLASLILVIYYSSRPRISSLGRVPGIPGAYAALDRHPENIPVPGVLILRLDSPMTYYNALTVRDRLNALVAASQPPPRAIILNAPVQDRLDITSGNALKGFLKEMQAAGIEVYMADVRTLEC